MQVKKFEAPTIQEALDTIKRELGPEAIILQTKKNRRGFGLMSKDSVEVTAAVSDRSMMKKNYTETRLPDPNREAAQKLPADRQADLYDKYIEKHQGKAGKGEAAKSAKKGPITATRYIEIDDEGGAKPAAPAAPSVAVPARAILSQPQAAGATSGKLGSGLMSVEEEVKHLKRMMEEMKSAQEVAGSSGAQAMLTKAPASNPVFQDVFEQLVVNGVDKRFAFGLVKKASFELDAQPGDQIHPDVVLDRVAGEIMLSTEVLSALSGIEPNREGKKPSVIALIGPTGVGKTTTVAKMASEAALRRNLKVGLINLDSYKVAAFDQLGTYAKILNVPFRSVSSKEDLAVAIQDFQALDLIIVDTTGRSQRDPDSLKEMQDLLQTVPDVRTHLVLSATTRDVELYDMASRFSIFRPRGIIISKLDEATIYGSIYNVSQKIKLPLVYFTTGQRVPEDIEEASRERLASLLLDL